MVYLLCNPHTYSTERSQTGRSTWWQWPPVREHTTLGLFFKHGSSNSLVTLRGEKYHYLAALREDKHTYSSLLRNNGSHCLSNKVSQHFPTGDAQQYLRYHQQRVLTLDYNYIVAVCKWPVLATTALRARKDIAHCHEEKHQQDLFIPQKPLRTSASIYIHMKGQRLLMKTPKPEKRPCKAHNVSPADRQTQQRTSV